MSNKIVPNIYRSVIDDVIANMRPAFDELGLSDEVLDELQHVRPSLFSLIASRVAEFEPPPSLPLPSAHPHPSAHAYPGLPHYAAYVPPSAARAPHLPTPPVKPDPDAYYAAYGLPPLPPLPPPPPPPHAFPSLPGLYRLPQTDCPSASESEEEEDGITLWLQWHAAAAQNAVSTVYSMSASPACLTTRPSRAQRLGGAQRRNQVLFDFLRIHDAPAALHTCRRPVAPPLQFYSIFELAADKATCYSAPARRLQCLFDARASREPNDASVALPTRRRRCRAAPSPLDASRSPSIFIQHWIFREPPRAPRTLNYFFGRSRGSLDAYSNGAATILQKIDVAASYEPRYAWASIPTVAPAPTFKITFYEPVDASPVAFGLSRLNLNARRVPNERDHASIFDFVTQGGVERASGEL
ncbi:hypothetical protein DFH09DRAFT_1332382 [Mycena vulgaris]|nr:hypothetical protein DFH09DRAFT_1332382 [Mycena vulgaris]